MPKQLTEAQTKLETVERQLETAKVEVKKPFAQESELAEKLKRLSALNALLNMDERGGDAIGMDDTPEEGDGGQEEETFGEPEVEENAADAPTPYPIENARQGYMAGGRAQGMEVAAAMADKPVQRASLKEKLAAYKAQASGADRADIEKAKRKEETVKQQAAWLQKDYGNRTSFCRKCWNNRKPTLKCRKSGSPRKTPRLLTCAGWWMDSSP